MSKEPTPYIFIPILQRYLCNYDQLTSPNSHRNHYVLCFLSITKEDKKDSFKTTLWLLNSLKAFLVGVEETIHSRLNTYCLFQHIYLTFDFSWLFNVYHKEFSSHEQLSPAVPQQSNGLDCGLYLLQFIEDISISIVNNDKPAVPSFKVHFLCVAYKLSRS